MNILNIRQELNEIIDKVQKLAIEIEEINNNKSDKYNINEILRASKQYPIAEHPLCEHDEYIKKIYITVLSSVIQYDGKAIEDRLIFLSRIMQGCNINIKLMDVIHYGMNLDNSLYDEFVVQISKADLQYNFVVDALIISSYDSKIESKNIEYIAEIASILNISNDDMKILCNIASSILMQSQEIFERNFDFIKYKLHYFICYTKEFIDGILCDTEEMFCFRTKKLKDICLDEKVLNSKSIDIMNGNILIKGNNIEILNKKRFYLNKCNITIEMTFLEKNEKSMFEIPVSIKSYESNTTIQKNYKPYDLEEWIRIENCRSVLMSDVNFYMKDEGIWGNNILSIAKCGKVQLLNVNFNGMELRPYKYGYEDSINTYIKLTSLKNLIISKLIINNCTILYDKENSYIIYLEDIEEYTIRDCEFLNIKYAHLSGYKSVLGFYGKSCIIAREISKCIFEGVFLIHGLNNLINCKIVNSPKLSDNALLN